MDRPLYSEELFFKTRTFLFPSLVHSPPKKSSFRPSPPFVLEKDFPVTFPFGKKFLFFSTLINEERFSLFSPLLRRSLLLCSFPWTALQFSTPPRKISSSIFLFSVRREVLSPWRCVSFFLVLFPRL